MLRTTLPAISTLALMIGTGCAMLSTYDEGVTPEERLEECRLLDRKVTEAGQLSAIGTALTGAAGLTAGFKDGNRQAFGIISGGFGLFAALTQYISQRQSSRYTSRNCQLILDFNPQDSALTHALQKLSYRPFVLDSLRYRKDSVKATMKARKRPASEPN